MRGMAPFDLSDVADGGHGAFDVVVSRERPAGWSGDWWQMQPGTSSLWLRIVSDRWGVDTEPSISIARVGATARRRPSTADTEGRLEAFGEGIERIVEYGIRHVDELEAGGHVNALKTVDYSASGGMSQQWYHEGLFDLADGEALVVEATLPEGCTYFSWSLTDRMLVTLDWAHAQTSLNRSQADIDSDGVLRVVVSGTDPGVRNWMDTTGCRSGVLQCREIGSTEPPVISTRVVPLERLLDYLPATTSRCTTEDRTAALAARRTGAQLRRLW